MALSSTLNMLNTSVNNSHFPNPGTNVLLVEIRKIGPNLENQIGVPLFVLVFKLLTIVLIILSMKEQ